jgi:hypothetical protein
MNELAHSSGKQVTGGDQSEIMCKLLKDSRYPSYLGIKKDVVPVELRLLTLYCKSRYFPETDANRQRKRNGYFM